MYETTERDCSGLGAPRFIRVQHSTRPKTSENDLKDLQRSIKELVKKLEKRDFNLRETPDLFCRGKKIAFREVAKELKKIIKRI